MQSGKDVDVSEPSKGSASGVTVERTVILIAVIAIILTCAVIFRDIFLPQIAERHEQDSSEDRAKTYVSSLMRDPSSVQFKNVEAHKNCVIGSVNAKNAFGGYTGFQDFFYNDQMRFAKLEPDENDPSLNTAESLRRVADHSDFEMKVGDCKIDKVGFH